MPLPVLAVNAIMERICELCLAWQTEREAPTKFTLLKKLSGKITTRVSSASFLDSRPSLVMFEILLGERYNVYIYIYTIYTCTVYTRIYPPRKKQVYTLQGTNISHPLKKPEHHLQNLGWEYVSSQVYIWWVFRWLGHGLQLFSPHCVQLKLPFSISILTIFLQQTTPGKWREMSRFNS